MTTTILCTEITVSREFTENRSLENIYQILVYSNFIILIYFFNFYYSTIALAHGACISLQKNLLKCWVKWKSDIVHRNCYLFGSFFIAFQFFKVAIQLWFRIFEISAQFIISTQVLRKINYLYSLVTYPKK